MDQQKVVVILLLITIILSIFSVVLTLSIDSGTRVERETINNQGPSSGQVSFAITPELERGAAG
jgi:hypothetical protein